MPRGQAIGKRPRCGNTSNAERNDQDVETQRDTRPSGASVGEFDQEPGQDGERHCGGDDLGAPPARERIMRKRVMADGSHGEMSGHQRAEDGKQLLGTLDVSPTAQHPVVESPEQAHTRQPVPGAGLPIASAIVLVQRGHPLDGVEQCLVVDRLAEEQFCPTAFGHSAGELVVSRREGNHWYVNAPLTHAFDRQ